MQSKDYRFWHFPLNRRQSKECGSNTYDLNVLIYRFIHSWEAVSGSNMLSSTEAGGFKGRWEIPWSNVINNNRGQLPGYQSHLAKVKIWKTKTHNPINSLRSYTGKLMREIFLEHSQETDKTIWQRRRGTHGLNAQGREDNSEQL